MSARQWEQSTGWYTIRAHCVCALVYDIRVVVLYDIADSLERYAVLIRRVVVDEVE